LLEERRRTRRPSSTTSAADALASGRRRRRSPASSSAASSASRTRTRRSCRVRPPLSTWSARMVDKARRSAFVCQQCGHAAPRWLGQCPGCGAWSTMVEEALPEPRARAARAGAPGGEKPRPLATVTAGAALRRSTGLAELDRVLGGGLVAGSVVLVGGDPGSVGQVRESAALLVARAKASGVACFLIGHVTKEGTLAGPRVLEHLVDTVLYFEGDGAHALRVLRAVKNRFGSTNEVAVFEMGEGGLEEVPNPSAAFLAERPAGARRRASARPRGRASGAACSRPRTRVASRSTGRGPRVSPRSTSSSRCSASHDVPRPLLAERRAARALRRPPPTRGAPRLREG